MATLWPGAVDADRLPLVPPLRRHADRHVGPDRLATQYWRANIDPSDLLRPVAPRHGPYRLAPGSTGFANLVVAGDWTDYGLNAGCVEAAVRSGQLAAAGGTRQNLHRQRERGSVTNTDGDTFAAGAADAARLAKEVQDLGFATARTIVERFVDLFAQFAGTGSGAAASGGGAAPGGDADANAKSAPFWLGGSDGSMRKLQADMAQAGDTYLSLMNQFSEASLRLFDTTRWWQPSSAEHDDLLLPEVAPGGRSSARLWLHNTTAQTASGLRPWCPGLAMHSGGTLPAAAVTCQPERIDRLEPGASADVVVTVAVPDDAAPGTYHGQLLVDGLPDVVFPLRVRVQPAADR